MKPAVVIFFNRAKPASRKALPVVRGWFLKNGFRVLPARHVARARAAVALGGDGTILEAARTAALHGVPVLGVNVGRLGFLSAADLPTAGGYFSLLKKSRLAFSERMMLEVTTPAGARWALNDCVIHGRTPARVIKLSAWVDGQFLGTYEGDGLIVSTPTGSTAYSLAAHGPVVVPQMESLLLTPINPHSLTQRPVVLAPDSVLEIRAESRGRPDGAMASMDGQIRVPLPLGVSVKIRRADVRARIVTDMRKPFFQLLREKLKWGER